MTINLFAYWLTIDILWTSDNSCSVLFVVVVLLSCGLSIVELVLIVTIV
jgi:hypothetical protein